MNHSFTVFLQNYVKQLLLVFLFCFSSLFSLEAAIPAQNDADNTVSGNSRNLPVKGTSNSASDGRTARNDASNSPREKSSTGTAPIKGTSDCAHHGPGVRNDPTLPWECSSVGIPGIEERLACAPVDRLSLLIRDTRFEIGYVTGEFIGLKQDYFVAGAFAPFFNCGDLFSFIDVKGYRFENTRWGASAGLGFRTRCMADNLIGYNLYYDFLQGHFHNFHRLGVGLEWLTNRWDVRINGYVPVLHSEQRARPKVFHDTMKNLFGQELCAVCRRAQFIPRAGFDLEVGIPIGCWQNYSSYLAAGPYYYNWRHKTSYWGGQVRAEFYWKSFVGVVVQSSYDRENHCRVQGQLLFYLPFNFFYSDGKEECIDVFSTMLYQPVVRNGTIFSDHCRSLTFNWDD